MPIARENCPNRRVHFSLRSTPIIDGMVEEGSTLVRDALELAQREPTRPALWVLDQVMHARASHCLDFPCDDEELGAPHRFPELIRQAFAPHLDPAELALMEMALDSDMEITSGSGQFE